MTNSISMLLRLRIPSTHNSNLNLKKVLIAFPKQNLCKYIYLIYLVTKKGQLSYLSDHVKELDDLLGHVVARGGLTTDHHSTGYEGSRRISLDSKFEIF